MNWERRKTGRIRHRVNIQKRLFRDPIITLVLQYEYEGLTGGYRAGTFGTWKVRKFWLDARPEEVMETHGPTHIYPVQEQQQAAEAEA
ncbi:hypothetical protein [Chachezhania sediminis]|uniref:hypothetical protein n=1 Tax=Chachezhania sediminis TaxID=2599291 RepID=UPI001E3156B0|nr:hypothetical protein [Chachezhania sediminis]